MKAAGAALLLLRLAAGSTPTYTRDIAPLIEHNCQTCHRPDGGGPFPLLTFQDVRKHARQIVAATARHYMPPWLPRDPPGKFLDERRLSPAQIRTLADWVVANCPLGDAMPVFINSAVHAAESSWQLGSPDLILTAAKPLHLSASGPDVFWNFVYPTTLSTSRYVRAVEIRPNQPRLLHHANLLVDRVGSSLHREKIRGSGFPGMDLELSRSPLDPESHFLFWKPGSPPYAEPDGFSWQLNPGNVLVLNTHLQPSGREEEVAPSIGIYFTDKQPTSHPILVELQHDQALNIPPGAHDFVIEDHLTLPVSTHLLAIYPHAHYLGTLLEGWATLPNGTRLQLIRIPHWDLNQQAVYRYQEALALPQGTVVSMRFHYDNSAENIRNPYTPPRLIRAGNAATDEMGHLWLQLLPDGKGDHRRPVQEAIIRHRIEQSPLDPGWHVNLAALLLSQLKPQEAVGELRTAIRLDPRRPSEYDMLGAALQNTGQLQPAIQQFRKALELQPDYMSAQYNLAVALLKSGNLSEALLHLETVSAAYPQDNRLQSEYLALRERLQKSTESR